MISRRNPTFYVIIMLLKSGEYMDIDIFFEKVINMLNLGKIISKPSRVSGGFTHKMYKVETDKDTYIVKLLNPNIMKRPTALGNYEKSDKFEELFKDNNIEAVYSLVFNNKKMQLIDDQYFYVYKWYDGVALKDNDIKNIHCEKIGKQLALIHNITLKEENWIEEKKNINWKYYIELAKEKSSPIYDMLFDKIDLLNVSMNKGNEVFDKLPNYIAVCHNDMDSKNVLWKDDEFKLIDLECLGYSNPYLELLTLALCWSGYETCNINFELLKTFIDSYFENSKLNRLINWEDLYLFKSFIESYFKYSKLSRDINWEVLYYANNGRLEWLEYNIKRALMLETNSEEEQQLGISEVKATINHVVYYDSIKDKIINAFKM